MIELTMLGSADMALCAEARIRNWAKEKQYPCVQVSAERSSTPDVNGNGLFLITVEGVPDEEKEKKTIESLVAFHS